MNVLANWVGVAAIGLAVLLAVFDYRRQQRQEQYFSPPQKKAPWQWGLLLFAAMIADHCCPGKLLA